MRLRRVWFHALVVETEHGTDAEAISAAIKQLKSNPWAVVGGVGSVEPRKPGLFTRLITGA